MRATIEREKNYSVKGFEGFVKEGVPASFNYLLPGTSNPYGTTICGIRVEMSSMPFDSLKEDIKREMKAALKIGARIRIAYDERGFGEFAYTSYDAKSNDYVVIELVKIIEGIMQKIKPNDVELRKYE
jgi:hypothetical protein